jgi:hypothetical protein
MVKVHKPSDSEVHWLRLALSREPNIVGVFFPHLKKQIDPVSKTLSFIIIYRRIPNDG